MYTLFSDSKEQALMERVVDVFLRNGIKSMTMDDVANELHVSKKTLYKYVKNRPELVIKFVRLHVHKNEVNINMIVAQSLNAVEEKIAIARYYQDAIQKINPAVQSDAKQYFPKAWEIYMNHRANFVLEIEKNNLIKGKKEGLYLGNLNEDMMARIYNNKFDMVFNGALFPSPQFNFPEVFITFMCHHLRGITTAKGVDVLEKLCLK